MMNMNVIHCHRWAFLQHSTCTNRHVAHPMRNDQYRRHNSWDLVLPTFRNLTMPYSKDIWGHRGPKPCPDVSGTCGVQYKPLLPLYAGCATRNITILKTFSPPEERLGGRGYYRRGLRCEDLDLGTGTGPVQGRNVSSTSYGGPHIEWQKFRFRNTWDWINDKKYSVALIVLDLYLAAKFLHPNCLLLAESLTHVFEILGYVMLSANLINPQISLSRWIWLDKCCETRNGRRAGNVQRSVVVLIIGWLK